MKAAKSTYRLLTSRQFRAVYEQGQKFNTPHFTAFLLRTDKEWQRLGITTTRKIGCAVLRNRCRRRLREIFRLRDRTLLTGIGFDLVLNAKPSTATIAYKELELALAQALRRFEKSLGQNVREEV